MGSVYKQQKNLTEEVDKLSNLPSCVISHILSFLPTKYAVRTSILSTRWKNNWKSISNLDFHDFIFPHYQRTNGMQASFVNFVYRVLLQLKSSRLNRFCLHLYQEDLNESHASHINSWVSAALLHDVREIIIHSTSFEEACFLPSDLFKCQTLVVLVLSSGVLKVPNSVCLPNLKVLRLEQLEFHDGESSSRLLSSCPVLKDLLLDSCVLINISVLKICSPNLKNLVLSGSSGLPNYRFALDAPQLEFLDFDGYSPEQGTLKNLHSLVKASIDFNWEECLTKEVFDDFKCKSPVFLKLRTLDYTVHDVYGCSLMKDMVESSPQLERLFLSFESPVPIESITHNIYKRLEVLELYSWFKGNSKDLEFVKHILKNANVLKKFEIYWAHFSEEIYEEVLAFPRASTSCEVVFCQY